ncbi:MAG: isoamylase early set domain-containing protein [Anaerolineae bacterium]|nr:isoamylase early set domain-containing protein [Anaerolineae bacterium]
MSIEKQYLKSKPKCKVKFRVTKEEAGYAGVINLVGNFNDWDQTATPMSKLKSGDFTATLYLDLGQTYEFRYLADGDTWMNDQSADGVTPSSYPSDQNSVINTTAD